MSATKNMDASGPTSARPFLRWAGGKQKLMKHLIPFVPEGTSFSTYLEPFLGAGSLFFRIQPNNAVLSDINEELVNCFVQVKRRPKAVSELVHDLASRDSRSHFYRVRSQLLDNLGSLERAARFIYLNKAAFNGIYRVNTDGEFNVPYGPSPKGPVIPSTETLVSASRCLQSATIVAKDFQDAVELAREGDFVYLDPPYPPLSSTSCFTHYSAGRFGWDDQVRVAEVFNELAERGCLVMLSNAGLERVKRLYDGHRIRRLSAVRWLCSNGDRFRVHEVVVTNYG